MTRQTIGNQKLHTEKSTEKWGAALTFDTAKVNYSVNIQFVQGEKKSHFWVCYNAHLFVNAVTTISDR